MKMLEKVAAMAFVAGALATPAIAQDMRSASEKVVACQSVADSQERLTCFETAESELSVILSTPQPVVAAQPTSPEAPTTSAQTQQAAISAPEVQVAPTEVPAAQASVQMASTEPPVAEKLAGPPKRRLLPSWVPTVSLSLGNGDAADEPDFFETAVTRIQRNSLGRHFFTTEDGQVWRQIQIEKIRAPKSLPAEATIRQTMTGSIRLEMEENGRSYPVNRVE